MKFTSAPRMGSPTTPRRNKKLASAVQDLYDLTQPLIDRSSTPEVKRHALHGVEEFLKGTPEDNLIQTVNVWRGRDPPLFAAVRSGMLDFVQLLLKCRAIVNTRDQNGTSALHQAVNEGQIEITRVLLTGKALVDSADHQSQTPLFFAADPPICQLLLDRKANASATNNMGMSPLHVAALAGRVDIFTALMSRLGKTGLELRDADGTTALECARMAGMPQKSHMIGYSKNLYEPRRSKRPQSATQRNSSASFRSSVANNRSSAFRGSSFSPGRSGRSSKISALPQQDLYTLVRPLLAESALHAVVAAGHGDDGESSVDATKCATRTPRTEVAGSGAESVTSGHATGSAELTAGHGVLDVAHSRSKQAFKDIHELLRHDPEQAHHWRGPETPLHGALQAGSNELLRILLHARASANELDGRGASALQIAACKGSVEMCTALLAGRAEINRTDFNGQTALFFAQTADVCKLLIQRRANLNLNNSCGQSALHLAGNAGLLDVLRVLCEHATDSLVETMDLSGITAWDYAQQYGTSGAIMLQRPVLLNLAKEGAVRASVLFEDDPKCKKKASPGLHALAQVLMDDSRSPMEQQRVINAIEKLLKANPKTATLWRGPDTPLIGAVRAGRLDLTQLLLQARADPCDKDAQCVSVLHSASSLGNLDVCQELLNARAFVHNPDCHGQTALFHAKTRQVAEMLVDHRADLGILNHFGQSPLHVAGRDGLQDVFKMLWFRAHGRLTEIKDLEGNTAWDLAKKTGLEHPEFSKIKKRRQNNSEEQSPSNSNSSPSPTPRVTGRKMRRAASTGTINSATRLLMSATQQADMLANERLGSPKKAATSDHHEDLYEVTRPLFDELSSADERANAYRAAQNVLKHTKDPHTWSGPGTPLVAAVQSRCTHFVHLLLRFGASPNQKTAKGMPLLHYAVFEGDLDMTISLLSARVEVETKDDNGQTALFFAAEVDVLKLLVEHSADLAVRDHHGMTPLHKVGKAAIQDVFLYMYEHADPVHRQSPDNFGVTPCQYAARSGILPDHFFAMHQEFNAALHHHEGHGLMKAVKSWNLRDAEDDADHAHFVGEKVLWELKASSQKASGCKNGMLTAYRKSLKSARLTMLTGLGRKKATQKRTKLLRCLSENVRKLKETVSSAERRAISSDQDRRHERPFRDDAINDIQCMHNPRSCEQFSLHTQKQQESNTDQNALAPKRVKSLRCLSQKSRPKRKDKVKDSLPDGKDSTCIEVENPLIEPTPAGPQDLYEIAGPLLDKTSSEEKYQRALHQVCQYLSTMDEPPDSWRGPGTPLGVAMQQGAWDFAHALLHAQAHPNVGDIKGRTPLHWSIEDGNTDMSYLLIFAKAEVNAIDCEQQTPLFYAPTLDTCQLLVEHLADISLLNNNSESVLHVVARGFHTEMYIWLSQNTRRETRDLKDHKGYTARDYFRQQAVNCPPTVRPGSPKSLAVQALPGTQNSPRAASIFFTKQNRKGQLFNGRKSIQVLPPREEQNLGQDEQPMQKSLSDTDLRSIDGRDDGQVRDGPSKRKSLVVAGGSIQVLGPRREQNSVVANNFSLEQSRPNNEISPRADTNKLGLPIMAKPLAKPAEHLAQIQAAVMINAPVMLLCENNEGFLIRAVHKCAEQQPVPPQVISVALHSHSSVAELYGSCNIIGRQISEFEPGVLTCAARDGHWIIFQGLNFAPITLVQAVQDLLVQLCDAKLPFQNDEEAYMLRIPGSSSSMAASILETQVEDERDGATPRARATQAQGQGATARTDFVVKNSLLALPCHANFRVFATAFKQNFTLTTSIWSHFVTIDMTQQAKDHWCSPLNSEDDKPVIRHPHADQSHLGSGGPDVVVLYAHKSLHHFLNKCYSLGRPGLIKGEDSCGKALAWHAWVKERFGTLRECIVVRLHADTSAADLMGSMVSCAAGKAGCPFRWQDGPVSSAVRKGHAVLLCGIHAPPAAALHCLASVLDGSQRGHVLINSTQVPIHQDFHISATSRGGRSVNPLILSYFEQITWQGHMGPQDLQLLCRGILGNLADYNMTEAMVKDFDDSSAKKQTAGSAARFLRRLRSILLNTSSRGVQGGKDLFVDGMRFCRRLMEAEKDGLRDTASILGCTLPGIPPSFQGDGKEDLTPLLWMLRAARLPAVLQGPANVGKAWTSFAFAKAVSAATASSAAGPVTITLNQSTMPEHILGWYRPVSDCDFEYVPGPLEVALKEGRTLVVMKINQGSPAALSLLVETLAHPPVVVNPITGERIDVHPNFWFIGTLDFDKHNYRCMLPDMLRTHAMVIPMEKYSDTKLRSVVCGSRHFPKEVAKITRESVLDVLLANSSSSTRGFDVRSYLRLCRRICGQATLDISASSPHLTGNQSQRRKTLLRLQGSADTGTEIRDFQGSVDAKQSIQRLAHLHILAFTRLPPGTPCTIERTKEAEDDHPHWVFTIEEPSALNPLHISVTFPASYDERAAAEVKFLGDSQKALLCQMALALRYQEPILVVGPSSFKAYTVNLLSRLVRFENFLCSESALNTPLLHKNTNVEDLVGGVEPHNGPSFATYCRRVLKPLRRSKESTRLPEVLDASNFRSEVENMKPLLTELTANLRKYLLQPESGTLGGRRIAESHKLMVTRLYELLKSSTPNNNIFPVCERGIMPTIRFGGLCLLNHAEEVEAFVLETVFMSLFELGQESYFHPGLGAEDKIEVHPQCYFVFTAASTESLSNGVLSRMTCLTVPSPSENELMQVFRSCLHTAAVQARLGNEATIKSLQARLVPVAKSLGNLRKVSWLASFAGALPIEASAPSRRCGDNGDNSESPLRESTFTNGTLSLPTKELSHVSICTGVVSISSTPVEGSPRTPRVDDEDTEKKIGVRADLGQWLLAEGQRDPPRSARWDSFVCGRHATNKGNTLWDYMVSTPSSRQIAWHLMAVAECEAHALPHPIPVFVGPSGMGKTFMCQQVAQFLGKPFLRIQCSANTEVEDLFGRFVGGACSSPLIKVERQQVPFYYYQGGAVILAVREGAVVLFDGLNLLQPRVLSAVIALFRSQSVLRINDIDFDPRVCLFCGTMNPEDLGEGRGSLPLLASGVVRVVKVEMHDRDMRAVLRKLWCKNFSLFTALTCSKILQLNLRGVLRLMRILPDTQCPDTIAWALHRSLPLCEQTRKKACSRLKATLEHAGLHGIANSFGDGAQEDTYGATVTPRDLLDTAFHTGRASDSSYPGFILISGPPCSGKRTLVRKAAEMADSKLIEIFLAHDTTNADLLGEVAPICINRGTGNAMEKSKHLYMQFVEGPLLQAVKNGWWCLLANIDLARPELVERLNSLGEYPPSLSLAGHVHHKSAQSQVAVHENFRLFCTVATCSNTPIYRLSDPLLDRCVSLTLGRGVRAKHKAIKERLEEKAAEIKDAQCGIDVMRAIREVSQKHDEFVKKEGAEVPLEATYAVFSAHCLNLRGMARALTACWNPVQKHAASEEESLRIAYGNASSSNVSKLRAESDVSPRSMVNCADSEAEVEATSSAKTKKAPASKASAGKDQEKKLDWAKKVEEFDKLPWTQAITLNQFNDFCNEHCGEDGSLLRTACSAHNREHKTGFEPNMWAVTQLIIRKVTQEKLCSMAQLINPEGLDVEIFVSHAWSQSINDTVTTLNGFFDNYCSKAHAARRLNRNADDFALWMCAMAINQHHPTRAKPTDSEAVLQQCSFAKVFERRLLGMVLLIDESCLCLTRKWCLSEVNYAYKYAVPVDIWASASDEFLGASIDSIDISEAKVHCDGDVRLIMKDVEKFEHDEFGSQSEGFNAFTKQMFWDMTLRLRHRKAADKEKDHLSLVQDHGANDRSVGIGGFSVHGPLEREGISERLKALWPAVEVLARRILRKRVITNSVRVIVDNTFLGIGLHPHGAKCVIDVMLCLLTTLASLRVDFEVVSAGDQRHAPCLLKSFEERMPVMWSAILQGTIGPGMWRRPTNSYRVDSLTVLAITAKGRGLELNLEDLGKQLFESGVRKMGCCLLQPRPRATPEYFVLDLQRSFRQLKARRVTSAEPLVACLTAVVVKDSARGDPQGHPIFQQDDPFLRDRHEQVVYEIRAPGKVHGANPHNSIKFRAENIADLLKVEDNSQSQSQAEPPKPHVSPRFSARSQSPRRDSKSKPAATPVSRTVMRARDVADKLRAHSAKPPCKPGKKKRVENTWNELREAFVVHLHHIFRALDRISVTQTVPSAVKPCRGKGFELTKIVKWFTTNGASTDVWEPKPSLGISGSLVMVADVSGSSCCDITSLMATTALTCEFCNISLGVLTWSHKGIQLVKPAPDRSSEPVLKQTTSNWDFASKSCFLCALADSQYPPKVRASSARMSDALLAAAAMLIDGHYPHPRRVMLVPSAFDPKDHRALLQAWAFCEEAAAAQCTAVALCPIAGPLPRSIVLQGDFCPGSAAHVIGSVFSSDTPYQEISRDLPLPDWVMYEGEQFGAFEHLPSLATPAQAKSVDLEYSSDVDVHEFHNTIRGFLANASEEKAMESFHFGHMGSEDDDDVTPERGHHKESLASALSTITLSPNQVGAQMVKPSALGTISEESHDVPGTASELISNSRSDAREARKSRDLQVSNDSHERMTVNKKLSDVDV